MPITALYAGLVGLLLLALSIKVVALRWRHRVGLGTGESIELTQGVRAHGNLTEYAPLVLFLIYLIEQAGHPAWLLHGLGAGFFVARVFHAQGLLQSPMLSTGRTLGVIGTFSILAIASIILIVDFVCR